MNGKKRILIVDDHTILREGIKAFLSGQVDIEVVGEARDGLEAIRKADLLKPDMVLMDLSMPGMSGMGAIQEIKRKCPSAKVLVLTAHQDEEYIQATLDSGADGYLLKDATHKELLVAITSLFSQRCYLSPAIAEKMIKGYLEGRGSCVSDPRWDTLTQRELDIIKMIAEGYKNREIADYLCISKKTVEKHRSNLMKKLDVHSASSLTGLAIEKGLTIKGK